MEDLQTLILGIEYKLSKLLDQRRKLEGEINDLQTQKNKLQRKIEEQLEIIDIIKEENKFLKIGDYVSKRSDITEIKLKINELVRQIDKCIGQIAVNEKF